jgi:hypothetical protein
MKKLLLILACLGVFFFNSCEVDENLNPTFPFKVTIKTLEDSVRVSNVFVEILAQTGSGGSSVLKEGYSNQFGDVSFEYDKEAVLLIRATRGTKPNYTFIGCDYIFLKANEEASRTIYIRPFDSQAEGC